MLFIGAVLLALAGDAAVAPAGSVIPFRTEAQPRVDPVFGDANALRGAVDRFLALQGEMDRVRDDFSGAVHETLAALGATGTGAPARSCPPSTAAPYGRALAAGTRYLVLGQQLQSRYRDIRRADDFGDTVALTPDYRVKVKKAKDAFQQLLNDYREMRVAFYDQLGAEMRHASCKTGPTAAAKGSPTAPAEAGATPNPSDPGAWTLVDATGETPADEARPNLTGKGAGKPSAPERAVEPPASPAGIAAPAIWIEIDNSLCAQPTRVAIDGQSIGEVGARKKTSVRTHAGPREICALPTSDARACGDAGTLRKAYLHEGWSLTVHCER
jgi:hypothetical protein